MLLTNDLAEILSLEGDWEFALGPESGWHTLRVPGCWEAQGHEMYTDGPARYRRALVIPDAWQGRHILLEFDAVSFACEVFWNGTPVGRHEGLWTPFVVEVTQAARPGEVNQVELQVYKPGNQYPMRRCLAGFLPDLATSFGGIWQPARLRAVSQVALQNVQIQAQAGSSSLRVQAHLARWKTGAAEGLWRVSVEQGGEAVAFQETSLMTGDSLDLSIPVPGVERWSPEQPALYTVQIEWWEDGVLLASTQKRTGFRELRAQGDQLLLNGQPFQVRGILSWGWNPDTIAPYYTLDEARREMRQARAMGFNLIKLCLFVPNQAYFDAADEEGMLLWEELPMWLPEMTPALRARAPQEYEDILNAIAHHPAIVLFSLGCELNQSVDGGLLSRLSQVVRLQAPDVLLCDNSGSGESYGGLDFDFSDFTDYHPYYDLHYFEPLLDHWRRDWQPERPWIFGEFCDSDSFRDQSKIVQANHGDRPWWLTSQNPVTRWRPEAQAAVEWADRLAAANTGVSFDEMTRISYRQSFVIRKYTLEALRRRRGIGGYVVTGLRDTPISTSGIWDDFLSPKWPAEDFRPFNSDDVLCLDVGRRRRWQHGGDRPDPLGPYTLWSGTPARWDVILHSARRDWPAGGRLVWTLHTLDGRPAASGEQESDAPVRAGIPARVGVIHWHTPALQQGTGYTLAVSFSTGSDTIRNDWPIWVYPRLADPPAQLAVYDPLGLLDDFGGWLQAVPRLSSGEAARDDGFARLVVATHLDSGLWQAIHSGGSVVLLQQGEGPLPVRRCPFWREAIKLFSPHQIWQCFPQQGFTNLQFLGIAGDMAFDTPRLLETLPEGAVFHPILRRLDAREFHISEYLFEAQYGSGRLCGCSLRLQGGSGAQPYGWNRNVAGAALLAELLRVYNQ
jgi:hypothetical protein